MRLDGTVACMVKHDLDTALAYESSCELTLTCRISRDEHLNGPQRKTVKLPTELIWLSTG
jgi:hypothetical protein